MTTGARASLAEVAMQVDAVDRTERALGKGGPVYSLI
jgi:hypothetical protein